MRLISEHLRNNNFAFMIDETPDASGVEQTAVVVRVVDEQLTPEEIFLGWHATANAGLAHARDTAGRQSAPLRHEPR